MDELNLHMFDAKAFAERLIQIRGNESRRSFAIRSGMSDSSILKYERLEALPNVERFIAMAVAAGVDLRWLACGDDWERILAGATAIPSSGQSVQEAREVTADYQAQAPKIETAPSPLMGSNDDFTFIDSYQVFASAGHGSVIADELKLPPEPFRTDELKGDGLKPERLAIIRAKGDSMEPTISNNEKILISLCNGESLRDGIYVLRIGESLLVKRLQFDPFGGLKIISDNPVYGEQVVTKEQRQDVHIVGRVVRVGKKF